MEHIVVLSKNSNLSKRDQICEAIGRAIAYNAFANGQPVPSCRALAKQLNVSRNTVFSAYCDLVELGVLQSKDRSGFVVTAAASDGLSAELGRRNSTGDIFSGGEIPDVKMTEFSEDSQVLHPPDWSSYPFPFIFNQVDPNLFPLDAWRECTRIALGRKNLPDWTSDAVGEDCSRLIQQLRQRLLSYRGILAEEGEILVTLGAQNALSILGLLFARDERPIGFENPGFQEARNAFTLTGNALSPVPVDEDGLNPAEIAAGCKLVFVTPCHHFPTMVTMPMNRREDLLRKASDDGFYIVEDDYEMELAGIGKPLPALRSMDTSGRVIYVGSLSKTISPSMRLGFILANREIIKKARDIRRLLVRHPPSMIQETAAVFLALGHHDAHLKRLKRQYTRRWHAMLAAVDRDLPFLQKSNASGGTSIWLSGPPDFDASTFCDHLREHGVLADKGATFYFNNEPRNSFRLGFAYVPFKDIEEGIRRIAELYRSYY